MTHSYSFLIQENPNLPQHLEFVRQPASTQVASTISPAPAVRVCDANGETVCQSNGPDQRFPAGG
jgi:hypothetical protein